jgi:hypothetical protein
MSKSFSETISFNGTVDQVLEMFRTPAFLDLVAKGTVSHSHKVEISGSEASVYLETKTDKIPSEFKKIFGKTVTIFNSQVLPLVQELHVETNGVQKIRTSVKQAQADSAVTFVPTAEGCSVTYAGHVKFDFPIGAGKAESKLLKIVISGITELERIGNEWLDQTSSST